MNRIYYPCNHPFAVLQGTYVSQINHDKPKYVVPTREQSAAGGALGFGRHPVTLLGRKDQKVAA